MTGRISDERCFTELSADYEAEQRELKEKTAALQTELSKAQEATVNAEKFMEIVRKYTSIEELTPTLLRELVEKIVIHEAEPLDGKRHGKLRRQNIDIHHSFIGKVDLPERPLDLSGAMRIRRIGTANFFTLFLLLYHTLVKRDGFQQIQKSKEEGWRKFSA